MNFEQEIEEAVEQDRCNRNYANIPFNERAERRVSDDIRFRAGAHWAREKMIEELWQVRDAVKAINHYGSRCNIKEISDVALTRLNEIMGKGE